MFKLTPNPTFAAEVAISLPGGSEQARISFVFKHRGKAALHEWTKSSKAAADDATFLGEVIESWSGVVDDAGVPIDYSPARLGELLDSYQPAGDEIFHGYLDALAKGAAKN